MARWLVPAGTQAELDTVITNRDVRNGEIVYNIDERSLMVGVLTDPNDNATGSYQVVVGNGQITNALIANNTIALTKLAANAPNTVVANATANMASPAALAINENEVLGRLTGVVQSTKITDAMIQSTGLALTSLSTQAANTVVANATTSPASPTALAMGTNTCLLYTSPSPRD